MIETILQKLDFPEKPQCITQYHCAEDGTPYQVWKIAVPGGNYVLKEAKGTETELYTQFFSEEHSGAPKLFQIIREEDRDYLLMEYIAGEDLRHCHRETLKLALDALISLQRKYWQDETRAHVGTTFDRSLPGRTQRREYLGDEKLQRVFDAFLKEYAQIPRTLCHDDLLPFNAICDGKRVVFIDWECGGILPYAASLARLIAHAEENPDAFFYMKEEDKAFAAEYYFDHFIKEKQISREAFRRTLGLFVFYEYCEWVYLGNKYGDTDTKRFRDYRKKAFKLADALILNL